MSFCKIIQTPFEEEFHFTFEFLLGTGLFQRNLLFVSHIKRLVIFKLDAYSYAKCPSKVLSLSMLVQAACMRCRN